MKAFRCEMDFTESHNTRLTKIVCTLGPSSFSASQIQELADTGMNVARINVSHGSREDYVKVLDDIRKLNEKGYYIATLLDTRGCEIRTGDVLDPIEVVANEKVVFVPTTSTEKFDDNTKVIFVGYDGFSADVRETDRILLDNGELSFSIDSIEKNGAVFATANQDGSIGSRRHINLPGADIDLPSITDKDWSDIEFAAENDVDFVALSFIRSADEVREVRDLVTKKKSSLQIITKIETQQAVQNIPEILEQSDGIMIARGDLGAEVPFEHLPVIQDEIIWRCRNEGKPVIVATHMLESMKEHPVPTRAEVTDVAHAAMRKTDATMLSGETASGVHPPVTVDAMDKILRAAETRVSRYPNETTLKGQTEAYAQSAVGLAKTSDASAIIVFTASGKTARRVSKFRPHVPIVAFCPELGVLRKLQLMYGVTPLLLDFDETETTIQNGMKSAVDAGLISIGDKVIIISDTQTADKAVTSIQVRPVK